MGGKELAVRSYKGEFHIMGVGAQESLENAWDDAKRGKRAGDGKFREKGGMIF